MAPTSDPATGPAPGSATGPAPPDATQKDATQKDATQKDATLKEVGERLAAIRRRIAAACERARRDPAEVTLIGISKRQPLARVEAAIAAGLESLGENQVQEAEDKIPRLPAGLDWHFVGTLQSNKARAAVRHFDTVHSVDRLKIARYLEREAQKQERRIRAFIQVHLGGEESKHGFPPKRLLEEIQPLADELERVEIVGLMTLPPYEEDLERMRGWFRRLAELRDEMLETPQWQSCPGWLSMGMSHDFEIAVEEGATHVRVGTAIFGERAE